MTAIHVERNYQAKRRFTTRPALASEARAHVEGQSPLRQELLITIAKLRSFAMLLCMDARLADRLVEVTIIRASVVMSPCRLGTNTFAWLCGRLRSYFYGEYAGCPAHDMTENEHASSPLPELAALQDAGQNSLFRALAELPVEQREALVLTAAAGFSQTEATRICSCPAHIFQSRLDGARAHLALSLSIDRLTAIGDDLARRAPIVSHLRLVANAV